MTGMDKEPLVLREVALDDLAREVEEDRAGAAQLLQDEALAAEEAGADALLPGDRQRYRFLGAQKGFLAADHRLAGGELQRLDRARETRREGDMPLAACSEIGDE